MKKHRQHYVWRKYLKSWLVNGGIFCRTKDKIFHTDLMNVAQCKNFYKIQRLSDAEVSFLRAFIRQMIPQLHDINEGWIDCFNQIYNVKDRLSGKIPEDKISALLSKIEANILEELYAKIENDGSNYIDSILIKDIAFFEEPEDRLGFLNYLFYQYMRTKRMRDTVFMRVTGPYKSYIEKAWPLMVLIFATNMTYAWHGTDLSIKILLNNTSELFITGDQPIVNTYALGLPPDTPPEKVELYYPVSPTLAVLISERDSPKENINGDITVDDVRRLNDYICFNVYEQIFASTQSQLESLPFDKLPWANKE